MTTQTGTEQADRKAAEVRNRRTIRRSGGKARKVKKPATRPAAVNAASSQPGAQNHAFIPAASDRIGPFHGVEKASGDGVPVYGRMSRTAQNQQGHKGLHDDPPFQSHFPPLPTMRTDDATAKRQANNRTLKFICRDILRAGIFARLETFGQMLSSRLAHPEVRAMIATKVGGAVVASCFFLFPLQSLAGDFDGWCFPATACTAEPMPIQDSRFDTCEEACQMKRPVNVNDMDAVLYYVECRGDSGSPPTERMLFMRYREDDGSNKALVLGSNGHVTQLIRCAPPSQ